MSKSDLPSNVLLRRQRLARWDYYMSSIFDGNILPRGWDDNEEDMSQYEEMSNKAAEE